MVNVAQVSTCLIKDQFESIKQVKEVANKRKIVIEVQAR